MSKKCPCIVGDRNILLADLIDDNQTGIKVRTDDPIQLADRILELFENEALTIKIANQAFDFVHENFAWDHIVQKMTQHFKS